jgi:hypothetical protein
MENTSPMPTPWGQAQTKRALAPGVFLVTTAGHGGILIGKNRARELLSRQALAIGRPFGNFLAYEEDCDVAAVFYEHPGYCTWMDAKKAKQLAQDSLHRWNPDYFKPE